MSIKEKLKAEIERLKEKYTNMMPSIQKCSVCDELLSFLATLEEEPVDLEEEYEQIKQKVCSDCPSHKDDYCGYVKRQLQRKCNYLSDVMYGYELGRQSKSSPERKLRKVSTWVSDTERELEKGIEPNLVITMWTEEVVSQTFPEQDGDFISEEDYRKIIRETARHFYNIGKQEKSEIPTNLDEAAIFYAENHSHCQEEADAFKGGAMWDREQGVSMEITEDTKWSEVDLFVHRNCDGMEVIQIRKKDE